MNSTPSHSSSLSFWLGFFLAGIMPALALYGATYMMYTTNTLRPLASVLAFPVLLLDWTIMETSVSSTAADVPDGIDDLFFVVLFVLFWSVILFGVQRGISHILDGTDEAA